eukprot:SM000165S02215  [mRNA]  locus=s165:272897:276172:+ [translate_table: standard]
MEVSPLPQELLWKVLACLEDAPDLGLAMCACRAFREAARRARRLRFRFSHKPRAPGLLIIFNLQRSHLEVLEIGWNDKPVIAQSFTGYSPGAMAAWLMCLKSSLKEFRLENRRVVHEDYIENDSRKSPVLSHQVFTHLHKSGIRVLELTDIQLPTQLHMLRLPSLVKLHLSHVSLAPTRSVIDDILTGCPILEDFTLEKVGVHHGDPLAYMWRSSSLKRLQVRQVGVVDDLCLHMPSLKDLHLDHVTPLTTLRIHASKALTSLRLMHAGTPFSRCLDLGQAEMLEQADISIFPAQWSDTAAYLLGAATSTIKRLSFEIFGGNRRALSAPPEFVPAHAWPEAPQIMLLDLARAAPHVRRLGIGSGLWHCLLEAEKDVGRGPRQWSFSSFYQLEELFIDMRDATLDSLQILSRLFKDCKHLTRLEISCCGGPSMEGSFEPFRTLLVGMVGRLHPDLELLGLQHAIGDEDSKIYTLATAKAT